LELQHCNTATARAEPSSLELCRAPAGSMVVNTATHFIKRFKFFRKIFGKSKHNNYICSEKENNTMRIISKSTLIEYYTKEPKAKTALEEWYEKTKKSEWTCFADIKNTFNSVDAVGSQRYVFNIKGNDYRLIVLIQFTPKTVYIRFVGTHKEYDAIKDIKNI
jgi:mRNA interferase HigB